MVPKENDLLRWEVLWQVFMLLGMIPRRGNTDDAEEKQQ